MEETRTKTMSEHREHFAKFVALLTGELGVEAAFGDEPGSTGSKRIVLPKIEDLDAKRLDFLYALCLREAGLLSMSKRSVSSIASHKTQGELATSFAIESGRVERALMRKFAGAQEILDQHWKTEAADKDLGPMAFGLDPAKAKLDQVFPFAAKWALIGKPSYGWDKLFCKDHWEACVEAVESEPMKSLIASSRLRKWDDARTLAGELWVHWTALRGTDMTPKLSPSPKAKALSEVEKALSEGIPNAISELVKKCEELEAKALAAKERARSILGDNQARLDSLNKSINAIGKQKAPFDGVANLLDEARQNQAKAESLRTGAQNAKLGLDSCSSEAEARKQAAEQAAMERATKDGEKASEIQKRIDELQSQIDAASAMTGLPEDVERRIADLERKVEQARSDMAAKQAKLQEQMMQEASKLDGAEGSRKAQLEKKIADLEQKIAEAQSKAAERVESLEQRASQMETDAHAKAQTAKDKMENQLHALEKRLAQAEEMAKQHQETSMQKAAPTANLQKRSQKLAEQMANQQAAAAQAESDAQRVRDAATQAAAKNKATAGLSEEELTTRIAQLEKDLSESQAQKSSITEPARQANEEARQAKGEKKDIDKQARGQARAEMQKLQDKLDAQGIQVDLVERMEEIDGWAEANDVQRQFDKQASEALGEPVINGSGGGAGNRSAMEEIALRAKGIEDINPNEIFSGVEKLSPLSGFSQTGADGGEGHPEQSESSGLGFITSKPHLVWRKDRDKVINAPRKDASVTRGLQTKYASEIGQAKKVFLSKMKPSFKTRFRGGREEGQLDGRSIWKLAARQGDDFYEIDCKKPDKKASATILVDMSGSLASLGDKAEELMRACVLMLSEGLSACDIDHEILGHSAPFEPEFAEQKIPDTFNRKGCRLETVVAKGFGDKSLAGLSSIELKQADNSDGEALRIALSRLKKRPSKKKILFMISDGKPFMQDADVEILDEDLRRALLEAAAQKVSVVSIGFGANGHPILGAEHIGIDKPADLIQAIEARL